MKRRQLFARNQAKQVVFNDKLSHFIQVSESNLFSSKFYHAFFIDSSSIAREAFLFCHLPIFSPISAMLLLAVCLCDTAAVPSKLSNGKRKEEETHWTRTLWSQHRYDASNLLGSTNNRRLSPSPLTPRSPTRIDPTPWHHLSAGLSTANRRWRLWSWCIIPS